MSRHDAAYIEKFQEQEEIGMPGKDKRGACYICGRELRGNIDFSRNVQCCECTDRRSLYYSRVKLEGQEREKASRMGVSVDEMRRKHAQKGPQEARRGKKSPKPRGEGG